MKASVKVEMCRQYAEKRHPGEQLAAKRDWWSENINETRVNVTYQRSPSERILALENTEADTPFTSWPTGVKQSDLGSVEDPRLEFVVLDKKTNKPLAREFYAISKDGRTLGRLVVKMPTPLGWGGGSQYSDGI
jgi:hypothetical protein